MQSEIWVAFGDHNLSICDKCDKHKNSECKIGLICEKV
jgi:hypothetical protein